MSKKTSGRISDKNLNNILLSKDVIIRRMQGEFILDSSTDAIVIKNTDINFVEVLGNLLEIHTRDGQCFQKPFNVDDFNVFLNSGNVIQVDDYLLVNFSRIQKYQVTGIPFVELDSGIRKRISPVYHEAILSNMKKLEQKLI